MLRKILPEPLQRKLRPFKKNLFKNLFGYDFQADGLMSTGHNLEFMEDLRFKEAWEYSLSENKNNWGGSVPDIRWRAHIACWAATNALKLNADYVECGVHTGLLSHTICHYLDFNSVASKFWLFDTFEGIPLPSVDEKERKLVENYNSKYYFDCFSQVKESFSIYNNVHLVKGLIPESFRNVDITKVGYLSIDLNNADPEIATLDFFWDKLVKGAIVVLDDYGGTTHYIQKKAIDKFCLDHCIMPVTLPTGQGLLIKNT